MADSSSPELCKLVGAPQKHLISRGAAALALQALLPVCVLPQSSLVAPVLQTTN